MNTRAAIILRGAACAHLAIPFKTAPVPGVPGHMSHLSAVLAVLHCQHDMLLALCMQEIRVQAPALTLTCTLSPEAKFSWAATQAASLCGLVLPVMRRSLLSGLCLQIAAKGVCAEGALAVTSVSQPLDGQTDVPLHCMRNKTGQDRAHGDALSALCCSD